MTEKLKVVGPYSLAWPSPWRHPLRWWRSRAARKRYDRYVAHGLLGPQSYHGPLKPWLDPIEWGWPTWSRPYNWEEDS